MSLTVAERAKYEKAWAIPAYRNNSPGAKLVDAFFDIVNPAPCASVIDFGAGAGAASRLLKDRGLDVSAVDLTASAWDQPDIQLTVCSLWHYLGERGADHAYCCDVMEHIPPAFVALTVERILDAAPSAFFSVSFQPDAFGDWIGEPLHLTVQPFVWWRDLFAELGDVRVARDLIGEGLFHVVR